MLWGKILILILTIFQFIIHSIAIKLQFLKKTINNVKSYNKFLIKIKM
jgi:hypothetical protein